jgi:gliding motility-associated-like protein
MGSFKETNAQEIIQSPEIRCLDVDALGGVTLTWLEPPYMDNSFVDYRIFTCNTYSGNYITWPSTIASATTLSYDVSPTNANSTGPVYFIIVTDTSNVTSGTSSIIDTLSTIFLSVSNQGGYAQLEWNPIHKPLLPSSSPWYKIYRMTPNSGWTFIDSTENLSYNDTIYYCDTTSLFYQVEIYDSSGCTSISNISGAKDFQEKYAPPVTVLDTLSVTPSNNVLVSWTKSTKGQVVGYDVEVYNTITKFQVVHFVAGINTTSYIYTIGDPSDSSLSFEVAAVDSCGNTGLLSVDQSTLWLKVKPDYCSFRNTLTWNAYKNLVGGVGGYDIFYSVNSGPYQFLAKTDSNVTSYVDSDLNVIEYRSYVVRVHDLTRSDTTASSNIVGDSIKPPKLPINNYLRTSSVILNTNEVDIEGYVDSTSGAAYYDFERSVDSTGGGFASIAVINASRHSDYTSYVDNAVNTTTQSYRYKIFTLDSCNKVIDSTNVGQTILLTATGTPGNNMLTWNDYNAWYAGLPDHYSVFRSVDGVNYSNLSTVHPGNSGPYTLNDDVSQVTTGQGTFYYYVIAVESPTSMYPFVDSSYSNIAEAYQDPTVFIPNAFDPKGINRIFKPVGVFIDVTGYDFIILNRWGDVLFETNDPTIGWDGTYKGGKLVMEGVYVYLLTYTSSKGEYFQRKGTVTLLK